MGMFDWVAFEMDCPKCTTPVRGFQSKDGKRDLQVVLPHTVDWFEGWCDECGANIVFCEGKMIYPTYEHTYDEYLPMAPDGKDKRKRP